MARWYGGALTTGLTVDSLKTWPDRVEKVSADDVQDAAKAMARQAPFGYRLSGQRPGQAGGEALMILLRKAPLGFAGVALTAALLAASPVQAMTKIERVVSPGGIEAWLVREPSVPLIAMRIRVQGWHQPGPRRQAGRCLYERVRAR